MSKRVDRAVRRAIKSMSGKQQLALGRIANLGETARVRLARRLNADSSAEARLYSAASDGNGYRGWSLATGTVRRLKKQGLIKLTPWRSSPASRPFPGVYNVSLTPKGREVVEALGADVTAALADMDD